MWKLGYGSWVQRQLAFIAVQGYDTEIVDNQLDALAYVKSREVFPDVVVIDTDHTYNTIQVGMCAGVCVLSIVAVYSHS